MFSTIAMYNVIYCVFSLRSLSFIHLFSFLLAASMPNQFQFFLLLSYKHTMCMLILDIMLHRVVGKVTCKTIAIHIVINSRS